ncbi:MAG: hypothetical protein ACSHXH_10870 [Marivita sp.]|uniref:hypothetical protein n=1 Tax=Marivita sp. TaxID=2003365 RepID=UPI003EF3CCEF
MADAKKFNAEIVKPTLAEFDAEFSCLRRAFLAVAVVDALAAQIFAQAHENGINPFDLLGWHEDGYPANANDSIFRHRLAENCTGFGLVLDVAKANKHAVLTRGAPTVKRSDQVVSKSRGYGLGRYGQGRFGGVRQIMICFQGGEEVYLEHQILEAHQSLSELIELLEKRIHGTSSDGNRDQT